MKESGINRLCDQGERIVLPRLLDVVASALEVFRKGGAPAFLAIDIRDAFHNIPAGTDKAYTAAIVPMNGDRKHVRRTRTPTRVGHTLVHWALSTSVRRSPPRSHPDRTLAYPIVSYISGK